MLTPPSSRLLLLALTGLALSLAIALGETWLSAVEAPPAAPPRGDSPQATAAPSVPALAPASPPSSAVTAPGASAAPTQRELLLQASREARGNCLRAMLTGKGLGPAHTPLFETDALLAALQTERIEAHAYGELPAIEDELRWLGTLTPDSELGERSWEDVRFLLGFLHGYVDAVQHPDEEAATVRHAQPASAYDREALRAFRGLDFGDLLGLWD